jgi:hypothetical protein
VAAITSPLDSIPADTSPRLCVARPTPSLSATSTAATTIDTSVVRRCACARSLSVARTIAGA